MLLIKNARVMDPASGFDGQADILMDDGKIVKIAPDIQAGSGDRVIDAAGCVAAPGLVDVHVHFRDPGFPDKEDILTGAKAAAAGGFTTVIMMANTSPKIDNTETLAYVLEKGKKTGIHVLSCANVTVGMRGKELTEMKTLAEAGAAGFTDDGVPILDEALCRRAMEEAAALGMPISFHEEDPAYIKNNGVNRGKASAFFGIEGSDRQAEISMVARDAALAAETGACVEIQHISAAESVDIVRKAKAAGTDIHAEATPHHFSLTEEAAIKYGTYAKMNPPLREERDRQAIIAGLQDGTIDIIATDHAPHTKEEKSKPITAAPSGIIGLETSLPLGITELVGPGYLSLMALLAPMTVNPARLYHLDTGYLAEGGPADVVIFNPEETFVAGNYASKAENTPFTGRELKGRVRWTVCGGQVVYEA